MPQAGNPLRIVLIGLSGSGKSSTARRVAARLRWAWADTDDLIVAEDGREIPRIFAESGEAVFRALEQRVVGSLSERERLVIATGGGAILDPTNREQLWRHTLVLLLDTSTAVLAKRVSGGRGGAAVRPLLAGDDPAQRLERLRAERAPLYALADWVIRTDGLSPDDVADEIVGIWQRRGGTLIRRAGRAESLAAAEATAERAPDLAAVVKTPGGVYPAYAGWDAVARLPGWLRDAGLGPVVHVIADMSVSALHGQRLLDVLAEGRFEPQLHDIAMSEERKSLDVAAELFDRLVAVRAERKHTVIAFGGGVATDMGGFVAATYLRGLPLVHVSTSLLGMVDAAIGGKVAVNHRDGKNLIGAFYQPRLVVADAALLTTLPRREFISGWAEVIKHALIRDTELLEWLEQDAERLLAMEEEPLVRVLRRSIAIKAAVVSADEREDGLRMLLNYGHTTGHALEAVSGYTRLLHGEAVAIGMVAAAEIGRRLGMVDDTLVDRQNRLLARFGLPLTAPGIDPAAVMEAMKLDKKVSGRVLRFVLLEGAGRATVRADVPAGHVAAAVMQVTAG